MTDYREEMLASPGTRMEVAVERSEDRQRDQPELTFSADSLEAINRQIGMWIATRISRRFTEHGRAAQSMTVDVNVTLDGESDPLTLPFRIGVADRSHRLAARERP